MWFASVRSLLPGLVKEIMIVVIAVVVVACICAGVFYALRSCDSDTTDPDFLEDARDGVLDNVSEQRAENDRRFLELEVELYDLRIQVENLDAEIAESANYREGIHDAIDLAISIDDVDRILRDGIPGVSGR